VTREEDAVETNAKIDIADCLLTPSEKPPEVGMTLNPNKMGFPRLVTSSTDDEIDSAASTPSLGPMHAPLDDGASKASKKPRLTLSAYRGAAIRLTPADPTRRFEDFYDLHAPECRVLGHGAYSTVRLAVRKQDGLKVAVKIIAKHDALRARRLRVGGRRYLEEWEILRRMSSHAHIINMLDLYESDDEIQLVMEYCEGGELFDAIKKKRNRCSTSRKGQFSEMHASHVTRQILGALSDLHTNGIVHRDVKPENILLVNDDFDSMYVKLADFGVARSFVTDASTSSSDGDISPLTPNRYRSYSIVGSNYYVAPEVQSGGNYDCAIDVYSLGVTLYILLCGYPPIFSGSETNPEVVFAGSSWFDISEDAKDLVRAMLNADVEKSEALHNKWIKYYCETSHSPSNAHDPRSCARFADRPAHLDLNHLYRSLGALQQVSRKRPCHAVRAESPQKRSKMERRTSSALIALADLYRVTSPQRPRPMGRESAGDLLHSIGSHDEVESVSPFSARKMSTAFLSA
jgi:serine/threonine protein kinase